MAARKNLLTGKKVTVSLTRNGLTLEVADVPAVDGGVVAKVLLDTMRDMVDKGYDELIQDAGTLGAGAHIDVPEDEDGEDGSDVTTSRRRPRRTIGFSPGPV